MNNLFKKFSVAVLAAGFTCVALMTTSAHAIFSVEGYAWDSHSAEFVCKNAEMAAIVKCHDSCNPPGSGTVIAGSWVVDDQGTVDGEDPYFYCKGHLSCTCY